MNEAREQIAELLRNLGDKMESQGQVIISESINREGFTIQLNNTTISVRTTDGSALLPTLTL